VSACPGFVFECESWCIPGVGVSPVLFRDASLARPWVCVCVGVSPLLALVLRVSVAVGSGLNASIMKDHYVCLTSFGKPVFLFYKTKKEIARDVLIVTLHLFCRFPCFVDFLFSGWGVSTMAHTLPPTS
jgi:hypothetical protein